MCARFGREDTPMCAHTVWERGEYICKPEAQKTNTNTVKMRKRSCEYCVSIFTKYCKSQVNAEIHISFSNPKLPPPLLNNLNADAQREK